MKARITFRWQSILFAAIVGLAVPLASGPSAWAQAAYKIGDRVETMSAGAWVPAEIIGLKEGGNYVIRYLETGVSGAWVQATNLRHAKAGAPATNPPAANTQPANAPAPVAPAGTKSIRERYGAREPRTCADTKAPLTGAITAELAKKYFICQTEKVWGGILYLVEDVKLDVGGGVPYQPNLGAFEAIDVNVPLYPIRGSYVLYQCKNLQTEHVGPPDTNCNTYQHRQATGYCYKTTFGDWRCSMADRSNNPEDWRRGVAPPKAEYPR